MDIKQTGAALKAIEERYFVRGVVPGTLALKVMAGEEDEKRDRELVAFLERISKLGFKEEGGEEHRSNPPPSIDREALVAFFKRVAPQNIPNVDSILARFEGDSDGLFAILRQLNKKKFKEFMEILLHKMAPKDMFDDQVDEVPWDILQTIAKILRVVKTWDGGWAFFSKFKKLQNRMGRKGNRTQSQKKRLNNIINPPPPPPPPVSFGVVKSAYNRGMKEQAQAASKKRKALNRAITRKVVQGKMAAARGRAAAAAALRFGGKRNRPRRKSRRKRRRRGRRRRRCRTRKRGGGRKKKAAARTKRLVKEARKRSRKKFPPTELVKLGIRKNEINLDDGNIVWDSQGTPDFASLDTPSDLESLRSLSNEDTGKKKAAPRKKGGPKKADHAPTAARASICKHCNMCYPPDDHDCTEEKKMEALAQLMGWYNTSESDGEYSSEENASAAAAAAAAPPRSLVHEHGIAPRGPNTNAEAGLLAFMLSKKRGGRRGQRRNRRRRSRKRRAGNPEDAVAAANRAARWREEAAAAKLASRREQYALEAARWGPATQKEDAQKRRAETPCNKLPDLRIALEQGRNGGDIRPAYMALEKNGGKCKCGTTGKVYCDKHHPFCELWDDGRIGKCKKKPPKHISAPRSRKRSALEGRKIPLTPSQRRRRNRMLWAERKIVDQRGLDAAKTRRRRRQNRKLWAEGQIVDRPSLDAAKARARRNTKSAAKRGWAERKIVDQRGAAANQGGGRKTRRRKSRRKRRRSRRSLRGGMDLAQGDDNNNKAAAEAHGAATAAANMSLGELMGWLGAHDAALAAAADAGAPTSAIKHAFAKAVERADEQREAWRERVGSAAWHAAQGSAPAAEMGGAATPPAAAAAAGAQEKKRNELEELRRRRAAAPAGKDGKKLRAKLNKKIAAAKADLQDTYSLTAAMDELEASMKNVDDKKKNKKKKSAAATKKKKIEKNRRRKERQEDASRQQHTQKRLEARVYLRRQATEARRRAERKAQAEAEKAAAEEAERLAHPSLWPRADHRGAAPSTLSRKLDKNKGG